MRWSGDLEKELQDHGRNVILQKKPPFRISQKGPFFWCIDRERCRSVNRFRQNRSSLCEYRCFVKLIIIIFSWRILWTIARYMFSKNKKLISYFKAFKTLLKIKLDELRSIVFQRTGNYAYFTINFYNISTKKHILEKKNKNKSSIEVLITCLN